MRQDVFLERRFVRRPRAAARHIGLVTAQNMERVGEAANGQIHETVGEPKPEHRRGKDDAGKPPGMIMRRTNENLTAHRVRERGPGFRKTRRDLFHQLRKIAVEGHEIVDMALAPLGEHVVGETLPAPVHADDGETARPKLAHDLEIFLDEFRAPAEEEDGAARHVPALPGEDAQPRAVLRREPERLAAFRHRIFGKQNDWGLHSRNPSSVAFDCRSMIGRRLATTETSPTILILP